VPSSKTVLVVEDDKDLRTAIASSIEELGVDVSEARDGEEALEILERGLRPGAILLDMWMPRLDGSGFLAAVRASPDLAHVPVITMTGGPDPDPEPAFISRVRKAFDVDELASILVSLC
jgi:chemosensory pili system protein ChpA (sensor histidine kinase/response regulator)